MSTAIVTISGWVKTEPTVRDTSKSSVGSFHMAVDRGFDDNKVTTWFKVTAFGNFWTDKIEKLNKGDMITVVGEISLEQYETRGETRASLTVYPSFMRKLKSAERGSTRGRSERGRGRGLPWDDEEQVDSRIDDDIPF